MRANIINKKTGQTGYQVPGSSLPAGWDWMTSGGSLPPLPQGGGSVEKEKTLDVVNSTNTTEKTLPSTPTTGSSKLMQFSNALNEAVNIARKKRQKFQVDTLGAQFPSSSMGANDFASIVSSLNRTDENFIKPLVNTAIDTAKSDIEDIAAIAKTAAENGAPASTVESILNSGNYSEAITNAGRFMTKPKELPSEKKMYSGSFEFTNQDLSDGASMLEQSKGGDGYVDPTIYKRMYDTWIAGGGLPQDFTKYYPPKQYVNPKNTWLPANLKSSSSAYSTSEDDVSSRLDEYFQ